MESKYAQYFGKTLFTGNIIKEVCMSLGHILCSLEQLPQSQYLQDPVLRSQIVSLYLGMEDILNRSADKNKKILRYAIEYITPTPCSEIVRQEVGQKETLSS